MLRITLAALCVLLLALLVGLTSGGVDYWYARSAPTPASSVTLPLRQTALCRPSENLCRMGHYITWCCRADQRCDTSTVGGCSQLPGG